jgi:hypothetical protein
VRGWHLVVCRPFDVIGRLACTNQNSLILGICCKTASTAYASFTVDNLLLLLLLLLLHACLRS